MSTVNIQGREYQTSVLVDPATGLPYAASGGGGGGGGTSDTKEATQLLVKAAIENIDVDVGALDAAPAAADGTGNYSIIAALKRGLLNWAALLGRIPAGMSTTLIGGKNRLDVTLGSSGAIGAATPTIANLMGGVDGSSNLRGLATDASGRIQTDVRAAGSAAAITIGTAFPVCRGIYVGSGGTIVATINGVNITFVGVAPGCILPIAATNIVSAGTTASSLVALY